MVILQGVMCRGARYFVVRKELDRPNGLEYTLYLQQSGAWHNLLQPHGLFQSKDDAFKAIDKAIQLGNWKVEELHYQDIQKEEGYVEVAHSGY